MATTMQHREPGESTRNLPTLCVINYNGEECLEGCLGSVLRQREDLAEVLLIDNGSQDRSLELVAKMFPQVRVVGLAENRGPAAARNLAIREAASDLVLLVDNDVELAPGCVESLMEALSARSRAVVAMPAVCYSMDRELVQYDGADSHFIGLMAPRNENVPRAQLEQEVHESGSVISACILVDRSRYPTFDLFDDRFFIYHEDHDFGYRTRAMGLSVLSVPTARCYHGTGTRDLSIRSLGYYSQRRVFFQIRNRWLFVAKNYRGRTLVVLAPVLFLYEISQFLMVLKKRWLAAWLRAVASSAMQIPSTLKLRRRLRRQRQRSDGELLVGGPLPLRSELTASSLEIRALRLLNRVAMAYWRFVESWL